MTDDQTTPQHVGHTPPGRVGDETTVESVLISLQLKLPGQPYIAEVRLIDGRHRVEVRLSYLITGEDRRLVPVKFDVESMLEGDPLQPTVLGPGAVKDLPAVRWDRTARSAVLQALPNAEKTLAGSRERWRASPLTEVEAMERFGDPTLAFLPRASTPEDRREAAETLVRVVRPDLDPNASKGAQRTWNSLVKLAEALDEHGEELAKGEADPVGAMASRHNVAPATIRTWLHRARQAGLSEVTPQEWKQEIPEILAKAREATGLTHEQAAMKSGMDEDWLKMLEAGMFDVLERRAHRRGKETRGEWVPGLIRRFANAVDLHGEGLAERYRHERHERRRKQREEQEKRSKIGPPAIGKQLRTYRVQAGLSVEELSKKTEIPTAMIERIEAERLTGAWGAEKYMPTYIRLIAEALDADPEPLIRQYFRFDENHPDARRARRVGVSKKEREEAEEAALRDAARRLL